MSNSGQVFEYSSLHIHNRLLQFKIRVCPISLNEVKNFVWSRATRQLLVKCYDSKKAKLLCRQAVIPNGILLVVNQQQKTHTQSFFNPTHLPVFRTCHWAACLSTDLLVMKPDSNRGWFHKSWAQGAKHRDRSIHLHPTPTPNFLRSFLLAQKLGARA